MIKLVIKRALSQEFTVSRVIVQARKAINSLTVVPGSHVAFVDLRPWTIKNETFAPVNGGSYRVDTRAAEVRVELPAAPADGFQFALRDMFENFSTTACVLERGDPLHKVAMLDVDELAVDFSPGTLILVFDLASKNWGL